MYKNKGVLFFFSFLLGLSVFFQPLSVVADQWVNGYYRSNGTYVNGYYRSSPDGNPYNNYSFPGNTNPYTGKTATGNPDTYLNNYYNNSYSGSSYSYPSYSSSYSSYTSTPSCPSNSYYDGISSCKCSYGYVASGSSCVSTTSYCSNKMGFMSRYNSLTNSCECMSGYEFNGSSCIYKSYTPSTSYYNSTYYPDYSKLYESCPAHSHDSLTDPTKCTCDTGYQINSAKDACVKSLPSGCFSSMGYSTTTHMACNGKNKCSSGFKFDKKKKGCVAK